MCSILTLLQEELVDGHVRWSRRTNIYQINKGTLARRLTSRVSVAVQGARELLDRTLPGRLSPSRLRLCALYASVCCPVVRIRPFMTVSARPALSPPCSRMPVSLLRPPARELFRLRPAAALCPRIPRQAGMPRTWHSSSRTARWHGVGLGRRYSHRCARAIFLFRIPGDAKRRHVQVRVRVRCSDINVRNRRVRRAPIPRLPLPPPSSLQRC